jgi:hypothetical protein
MGEGPASSFAVAVAGARPFGVNTHRSQAHFSQLAQHLHRTLAFACAVAVAFAFAFRCHPEPTRAKRGWVRDLLLLSQLQLRLPGPSVSTRTARSRILANYPSTCTVIPDPPVIDDILARIKFARTFVTTRVSPAVAVDVSTVAYCPSTSFIAVCSATLIAEGALP